MENKPESQSTLTTYGVSEPEAKPQHTSKEDTQSMSRAGRYDPKSPRQPLDFEEIKENADQIWESALDAEFEIENRGRWDLYVVQKSEQPENLANCTLGFDGSGVIEGWCSCEEYAELGYCVHLCTIRQEAVIGQISLTPE